MNQLAALVPMRHHSQRVPGKNFRHLAGKPLFHHILESLLAVPQIQEIAVDTDSEPIMEGLNRHFPQVRIIHRPQHLRGASVPMNEILIHDIGQVRAEFYLQTHSTNPVLKPETLSGAIDSFFSSYLEYDSLFSVTRMQSRFYDQVGKAINHNPQELIQTQDLPPIFEENSCIYIFNEKNLLEKRHRIGPHAKMYEISAAEAWDIDEEFDFEICDFLLRRQVHHE